MPKKIMIFELDSINQADIFEASDCKADAIREITGMIRSALVFSGELVVTDSMLLDGWYFHVLGPQGLASELGVSLYDLPLHVIGLADSLRNSLARKLSNNAFVWQTNRSADGVWPTAKVAEVWNEWCLAEEQHYFDYSYAIGASLPQQLSTRMDPQEYFNGYDEEILELATAHQFSLDRSKFFTEFEALKNSGTSGGTGQMTRLARQHSELYTWWNAAYLEMIAEQNGANWISFSRLHVPRGSIRFASGHSFKVSKAYLSRMKTLTPGAFGTVISSVVEIQQTFMKKPTTGNLRGLVYASMGCLEAPRRVQVLRSSVVRALLAMAVIVVSMPAIDFSGIGLATTWIVFGIMAVATAPWGELNTLRLLLNTADTIELMMIGEHAS